MKLRRLSRRHDLVMDFGISSLKVRERGRGLELSLERGADGRILSRCREEVPERLRGFLGLAPRPEGAASQGAPGRPRRGRAAVCGIPARGVSLRSVELPAVSREETERLLTFQLERMFPLPLDQLAFGYRAYPSTNGVLPQRQKGSQEIIVAALRREVLEEYATLLAECGLSASFLLGSLAATGICACGPGHVAVLDIGRTHSELVSLVDGRARTVRSLPWGGELATSAIATSLGVHRDRAEEIKINSAEASATEDVWESLDATRLAQAVKGTVSGLARALEECWKSDPNENGGGPPRELLLLGGGSRLAGLAEELEQILGGTVRCRCVETPAGTAVSAVTEALADEASAGASTFRVEAAREPARQKGTRASFSLAAWLAAAVVLVVASLGLRFAPPFLDDASLEERIRARQNQLSVEPEVDSELSFLTMVQSTQTPYLEVLTAIANAAPPGSFISELSINDRGEASLRGRVASAAQVEEFRKKLSLSGWFSRIVIQERTPQKKHMDFHLLTGFRFERAERPAAAVATEGAQTGAGETSGDAKNEAEEVSKDAAPPGKPPEESTQDATDAQEPAEEVSGAAPAEERPSTANEATPGDAAERPSGDATAPVAEPPAEKLAEPPPPAAVER